MSDNQRVKEYREYLKHKRVDVLGAGISNAPLVDFLLGTGAIVTVRDKKDKSLLPLDVSRLEEMGVCFVTGDGYLDDIKGEVIFRTPGIRYDYKGILEAMENGAMLTSEMEAFLSLCPCKIIVITGSDGKSTTSTLTAKILEAQGYKVYLGGNIGFPLLSRIDEITEDDFVVLELSSFQLHTINRFENAQLPYSRLVFPDCAVITNISPNHLNWHTDMDEYVESKAAAFRNMREGSRFVTNADYPITAQLAVEAHKAKLDVVQFSSKTELDKGLIIRDGYIVRKDDDGERGLLSLEEILIPGIHNAENYMAAIALTESYVSIEAVKKVAHSFGGVEHRLELCRVKNGVKFYNSSIDSSPSRTLAALSTFKEKSVVMIMGGADKNIPFDSMGEELVRKARAVFLSGPTSQKIADCIKNAPNYAENSIEIHLCDCFDEAVKSASVFAGEGDSVLLSPACTSFDAFKNFEERGRRFKELVKSL